MVDVCVNFFVVKIVRQVKIDGFVFGSREIFYCVKGKGRDIGQVFGMFFIYYGIEIVCGVGK